LETSGRYHIIHYNENFDHPLINGGWNTLRDEIGFPNNVDVRFAYYGYSCFSIINWYNLQPYDQIRPFHSRSTLPSATHIFNVLLTQQTVDKNKLVKFKQISFLINYFSYTWN
jgi:hypothetical protein